MEFLRLRSIIYLAPFINFLSIVHGDGNGNVLFSRKEHDIIQRDLNQLDSACNNIGGTCQNKDNLQCTGSYITGKCTGPENIKCCVKNITLQDTRSCSNVPVLSRDTWGAKSARSFTTLRGPVGLIFIHHTAGTSCTSAERCVSIVNGIQRYHMETRNWDDIAYSFLVGEDGRIYEGRGWRRVGSHTAGYNSRSLAVCIIGTFSNVIPNKAALDAVHSLLSCGVNAGYLDRDYKLYGHRDVSETECPGNALNLHITGWPHYNSSSNGAYSTTTKSGNDRPIDSANTQTNSILTIVCIMVLTTSILV